MLTQWIQALKSGQYKQDMGALCTNRGHCAMGVLCEIHPDFKLGISDDEYTTETDDFDEADGYIYKDKLYDEIPPSNIVSDHLASDIVQMNDDKKMDFTEIADWLEENATTNEDKTIILKTEE